MALNDPGSGVSFDAERNLFFFSSGNGSIYSLYHCPFCGGIFPDDSKPVWVPILSDVERERLESLFRNAKDAEELFLKMGKPDYDVVFKGIRSIDFYGHSELANIECWLSDGQMPDCKIVMKRISPRHQ